MYDFGVAELSPFYTRCMESLVFTGIGAHSIGDHAFSRKIIRDISGETSNITSLGRYAFASGTVYCPIPNNVETIEQLCFYNASAHESMTINGSGLSFVLNMPKSIKTIEEKAFYNTSTNYIIFNTEMKSLPAIADNSFYNTGYIVIPDNLESSLSNSTAWTNLKNKNRIVLYSKLFGDSTEPEEPNIIPLGPSIISHFEKNTLYVEGSGSMFTNFTESPWIEKKGGYILYQYR